MKGSSFLLCVMLGGCSRQAEIQEKTLQEKTFQEKAGEFISFYSNANTIGFYLLKEDGSQIGATEALGTKTRFLCNVDRDEYFADEVLWITEERKLYRAKLQKGAVQTEELAELSEAACVYLEENSKPGVKVSFYEGAIYLEADITYAFSYETSILRLNLETGEAETVWSEEREDGYIRNWASKEKYYQIDPQNIYVRSLEKRMNPQENELYLENWKEFCKEACQVSCQKEYQKLCQETSQEANQTGEQEKGEKEAYLDLLSRLPEEGWVIGTEKYCLIELGDMEENRVMWLYDYEAGEELGIFFYESSEMAQPRDGWIYYADRDGNVHARSLEGTEQIYDCNGHAVGGVQFLEEGFWANVRIEGEGYGKKYFPYSENSVDS